MEEKGVQAATTPKNILARMQVAHLGKITFNLQFLAVAVMAASVLSFLAMAVFYLLLLAVTLVTLGLIYAAYPSLKDLWSGGAVLESIFNTLAASWPYAVPAALALSVASIIFLCFDYRQKHVARITISAVIAVISVIVLVIKLVGGAA